MPPGPPIVSVLNGPDMNMLGRRQPETHGAATLDHVEQFCADAAQSLDFAIDFRQSDSEGGLVSWIQQCRGQAAGVIAGLGTKGYAPALQALAALIEDQA